MKLLKPRGILSSTRPCH